MLLLLQVFYVIEGAVNCKIHETSFIISTGGMFLVPRGLCQPIFSNELAKLILISIQATSISSKISLIVMQSSFSLKRARFSSMIATKRCRAALRQSSFSVVHLRGL